MFFIWHSEGVEELGYGDLMITEDNHSILQPCSRQITDLQCLREQTPDSCVPSIVSCSSGLKVGVVDLLTYSVEVTKRRKDIPLE